MFPPTPRSCSWVGTERESVPVNSRRRSWPLSHASLQLRGRSRFSRRAFWGRQESPPRSPRRTLGTAPVFDSSARRNVSSCARGATARRPTPGSLPGPDAGPPRRTAAGARPRSSFQHDLQEPNRRAPRSRGRAGAVPSNRNGGAPEQPRVEPSGGGSRGGNRAELGELPRAHSTRSHREEMVYPIASITPAKIAR